MCSSEVSGHLHRLRRGAGFLLALGLVLGAVNSPSTAQEDERTKEIREVEKKLEELKQKLAALKGSDPTKGRQPLTINDALAWRTVSRETLSRDGQWFAAAILPSEGKGEVIVRQTNGDKEHKFAELDGVGNLAFSADSKWVAFSVLPKRGGTSPALSKMGPTPSTDGAETGKVVLVNVESGSKREFPGVTRFTFSGPDSNVLAMHKSPTATATTSPNPAIPSQLAAAAAAAPSRSKGADLILHELATGRTLTLGNVAEFGFNKAGSRLTLLLDTQGQLGNGVQIRDMKTAALHQLESGKASYEGLVWTEKGDAFALLKGIEDKGEKRFSLLLCTEPLAATPTLTAVDPATDAAFPKELMVSAGRRPTFSEDREIVFFGIGKAKKNDSADKAKGKEKGKAGTEPAKSEASKRSEKPDLVIWHWNDVRLQSEQEKSAALDRQYTYLCAYRLKDKKFLRLADDAVKTVNLAEKQRYAIGLDRRAYERALDGKRLQDVYVIDLKTGERRLALKQNRYLMGSSPDGTKFLYFDDGQYHVYDMVAGATRCITKDVPTSFIDTDNDRPVDRPPTFSLGWTKDSAAVLLHDGWDVWKVPVAQGQAVNLTGNGKKDGIRYRTRVVFDEDEKGIDLDKPQVFTMYGEWTKKSGYVRIDPKGERTILVWDEAMFLGLKKAQQAEVFVHTRQTTTEYPDWYSSGADLKNAQRLTNANPQQQRFQFCSGAMLVTYESAKGDKLQGALYLPANYEKGKKYPTVVYIYEKLSQNKNRYQMPRLSGSGFNASLYTSNGYAVFEPDITYKLNDPGMSALWCVMPALEAAIATGVVDRDRVGLHGHSWGGYQTAFLITQTPAFKAAVAGAPLTDLISMYSSIYWNVGITNQQIFESSQGRFTGGYWDMPEAYIRNSPVFHAKNVVTPLIILHNDKDGAVDFNQGIEYFNTLRRMEKPVVMLQYRGENHGLAKQANMKDYMVRMREFFDHHLQGKPAPAWLKEGVPHLQMDEHLKERGE